MTIIMPVLFFVKFLLKTIGLMKA